MNTQPPHAHEEWWLATLGRTVVWARLRVREAGTAEVFDSDGNTLVYDSEDTARAMLLDADFVAFDGAVNSGPARGARWLQSALGVTADGKIGPATIKAATNHPNPKGIVNSTCDHRMTFLRGLKTWATFGKGWSSRVTDVRSKALAMVTDKAAKPVATPSTVGKSHNSPSTGFFAWLVSLLKGNRK